MTFKCHVCSLLLVFLDLFFSLPYFSLPFLFLSSLSLPFSFTSVYLTFFPYSHFGLYWIFEIVGTPCVSFFMSLFIVLSFWVFPFRCISFPFHCVSFPFLLRIWSRVKGDEEEITCHTFWTCYLALESVFTGLVRFLSTDALHVHKTWFPLLCNSSILHLSLSPFSFYECRERIPKEQETEGIEVRFERLFSGFCFFMKMFSSSFFLLLSFSLDTGYCCPLKGKVALTSEKEWRKNVCEWKEFVPLTVFHFLAFLFSLETWVYFVMMKMCAQNIVREIRAWEIRKCSDRGVEWTRRGNHWQKKRILYR